MLGIVRIMGNQSIYHIMITSIKEVEPFETTATKKHTDGADISRIMHSINFSYDQYFNP